MTAPDGLVVVDKPAGCTSHDVVSRCRRIFGQRRVGHAGTLDPGATGVLLVGLGKATRLLRFLSPLPKSYVGEVVLGVETSTLDDAGDVVATFGGPFASQPADLFNDPYLDEPTRARLRLLFLRDAEPSIDRPDGAWLETSRTADAVRITAEEAGVRVSEATADPGHPLERLADLVALTDFAAVYLALAGGVDPLTSPHVADLRDRTR
jgi:hypothetical protein